MITAGHVHFTYLVDAEPSYDTLNFYLDGKELIVQQDITAGWVDFSANMSAGYPSIKFIRLLFDTHTYHVLVWTYRKDNGGTGGQDATFIKSIEISGITYPLWLFSVIIVIIFDCPKVDSIQLRSMSSWHRSS